MLLYGWRSSVLRHRLTVTYQQLQHCHQLSLTLEELAAVRSAQCKCHRLPLAASKHVTVDLSA